VTDDPTVLKQKAAEIADVIASFDRSLTAEVVERRKHLGRIRLTMTSLVLIVMLVISIAFFWLAGLASAGLQTVLFGIGSGVVGSAVTFLLIQGMFEPFKSVVDEMETVTVEKFELSHAFHRLQKKNGQCVDLVERDDIAAAAKLQDEIEIELDVLSKDRERIEIEWQRRIRQLTFMNRGGKPSTSDTKIRR
jgi:hypothetical protein